MAKNAAPIFLACLLAAAPAPKEDTKTDAERLQGTWRSVSVESKGESEDRKELLITFEKDTLTLTDEGKLLFKGKFKLDPSKPPKAIDVTITESTGTPDITGTTIYGIYEIGKDTFKWCAAIIGEKDRPNAFTTTTESPHSRFTFERQKP